MYKEFCAGPRVSAFASVLLGFFVFAGYAHASRVGFVTGDSYSNDSTDWPFLMQSATMHSTAIAGQKLITMATTFESQFDQQIADYNIDFAVVQGGVNDVMQDIDLASMENAVTSMASIAESRSMPLLVVNIAPWTHATTQAQRDEIDAYNSWLGATYGSGDMTAVADIYSLLVDPAVPQQMNPIYDADGVHPNPAGFLVIAGAVDTTVGTLLPTPLPAAGWLFVAGMGLVVIWLTMWRRCGILEPTARRMT
jgi:lysophospholipase L1-like esterase